MNNQQQNFNMNNQQQQSNMNRGGNLNQQNNQNFNLTQNNNMNNSNFNQGFVPIPQNVNYQNMLYTIYCIML